MKSIAATLTFIAFFATYQANAQAGPDWDVVGSGCIPSDDSSPSTYNTSGSKMNFKGNATGDIHLTCPVRVTDGANLTEFDLKHALDADGAGTTYYIEATLKYVEFGSNPTNICTVMSSYHFVGVKTCDFADFNIDTDVGQLYFYVRLHRSSSAYNPSFNGLRLY